MNKITTCLMAVGISTGGMIAPTPAYAHGPIYSILHYCSDPNIPCQHEVGGYIEYCDGHSGSYGGLDIYSYTDYYTCP